MHKHITSKEREIIALNLAEGLNYTKIANLIGKHKSTISREIRRNLTFLDWKDSPRGTKKMYFPDKAHKKYKKRLELIHLRYPFKNLEVYKYVINKLKNELWSPKTISGRMKKEYPDDLKMRISHECIYQNCFSNFGKEKQLNTYLLRAGKKRKTRIYRTSKVSQIKNRIDISDRPFIDDRAEFGHWESDTIVGIKQTPGAFTTVERKTRFIKACLIRSRKANIVTKNTKRLLNPKEVLTITNDNGKEFTGHKSIAKSLNCKVFFCHPYHSWERGTNENANGLIRRFFPKGTDFRSISNESFQIIVNKLNNMPRECLNWSTASEAYNIELAKCCI